MATEGDSKPAGHPPYPEMIMAAIAALGDKDGSNKSAIAKYISATYQDLPDSNASLLSAHLASMKESGQLLFIKNNYLRPGPGSPPKRGRGRPPKPKPEDGATAEPPPKSPRPRGRPPKPKDPISPVAASPAGGKPRGRGRPPKKANLSATGEPTSTAVAAVSSSGVKRGRGRPPKAKPASANEEAV